MSGTKRGDDGFHIKQGKKAKTESTYNKALFNFMRGPPSLEEIASVSAAIRLWTQPHILKGLSDTLQECLTVPPDDLKVIEKGVLKQLDEMIFPNSLKVKILNVIGRVKSQMVLCCDPCFRDFKNRIYVHGLFKQKGLLFWTMEGKIDFCESLKVLIDDPSIINDKIYLFKTACKYCLKDSISKMWPKVPSGMKISYNEYDNHLVAYWIYYLRNQLSKFLPRVKRSDPKDIYDMNCSIPHNMVSLSIEVGHVYSLKYFWYKLTEKEKIDNIKKWLLLAVEHSVTNDDLDYEYGGGYDDIDVICFLLPYLYDQNELKEVLQNNSGGLLRGLLLSWPQNPFFLSTLNVMMTFNYLNVDDYGAVMECVFNRITERKMEVELFRKVWSSIPLTCKKSLIKFITEGEADYVISSWDVEVLHVILEFSSAAEKKDIILRMLDLIKKDNYSKILNLIYTYIPKTMSSDQEINMLKVGILLNFKFLFKLLYFAGVESTEKLVTLCFQALNGFQGFQEQVIDVAEIYRALVIIGKKEYIDQFLKWHFEGEDQILKFKIYFLNAPLNKWFQRGNRDKLLGHVGWCLKDIITESSKRWKVYENVIHDSLCSPEEILQFKKDHLRDVIYLVQDKDFELALMFANWFFISSDKVEIKEGCVGELCGAFVILGDFNYLEQFLKLYFKTEDEIKEFKINCLLNQTFSDWNLKCLIPECDEREKLIERLLNYCFCSSEEVALFKEKQLGNVVEILVMEGDFQLASMLLNWSFDSNEAVHRYKINLFMSYSFQFVRVPEFRLVEIVKDFLRWISPTPTDVETFKNNLKLGNELTNYTRQGCKTFIHLLDCFVRESSTPGCTDSFEDYNVPKATQKEI